jgi:hypothetical protein
MENERLKALIAKAMASGSSIIEEAIRAAYEHGFDDGITHVVKTARNERIARFPVASRESPFNANVQPKESKPTPRRAPYGLCRRAIAEAFKITGDTGIDLEMVSETGFRMEGGPKLASSSVRSTLIEMQSAGEVARRGARWYRVSHPENETAGPGHEANPAASFAHNQGGHNGTALANH